MIVISLPQELLRRKQQPSRWGHIRSELQRSVHMGGPYFGRHPQCADTWQEERVELWQDGGISQHFSLFLFVCLLLIFYLLLLLFFDKNEESTQAAHDTM